MNDEIKKLNLPKEIEKAFNCVYYELSVCNDELLEILNYIINLKKEKEDYKSKNGKAVEYIKENKDKYYHDWGEDDGSYDTYLDETEIDKLLNILNGGNNE